MTEPQKSEASELRYKVNEILGNTPYSKDSLYDQLWEQARSIVRKRDKPQYQETMNELAQEEFNFLQVNALVDLCRKHEAEAEKRGRMNEHCAILDMLTNDDLAELAPASIQRLKRRLRQLKGE